MGGKQGTGVVASYAGHLARTEPRQMPGNKGQQAYTRERAIPVSPVEHKRRDPYLGDAQAWVGRHTPGG